MSKIQGTASGETLRGTNKNDKIYGYDGDDTLFGDKGNDHIYGNHGNDTIFGNDGNDHIYGNEGNNTLFGGNGNDIISTGSGFDQNNLFGESGNDLLLHNQGSYTFDEVFSDPYSSAGGVTGEGGTGNDTYRLESEWEPGAGPLTYRVLLIDYPDYESARDVVFVTVGGMLSSGGGVTATVAMLYDVERIEIEALPGSKFEVLDFEAEEPNVVFGDIEIVFNGVQAAPGDPFWYS